MILTTCAACAAPLAHDAPRCIRCHTRYCDATCQHDHWRRGHKQICKRIHRGGNAEQYYADKKYKEAVAEAVEACRGRHEGQKCYICLEAVHPRTGEGLVRGCACGDRDGVSSPELGVAHVSCLADQAKIFWAESEDKKQLHGRAAQMRWARWQTCSLCEQDYHGIVRCALGWACWKTYLGRPETDRARRLAMTQLGNGLFGVKRHEEELSVGEAELSTVRRTGTSVEEVFRVQSNLACTYEELGRNEDALQMRRDVYSGYLKFKDRECEQALVAANNYALSLIKLQRFGEARSLLRKTVLVARRVHGDNQELVTSLRRNYARVLYDDPGATLDDMREAVTTLEELERIARRVLGGAHPLTTNIGTNLRDARAALRARETPPGGA